SEPTSCSIASTSRGSLPLLFSLFFLSRIRPPPTSTLFPYTTLFRSVLEADLEVENGIVTFVQAQQRADDLRKSVDEAWLALQVIVAQYQAGQGGIDFNRYATIHQTLITQQDQWDQSHVQICLELIPVSRVL